MRAKLFVLLLIPLFFSCIARKKLSVTDFDSKKDSVAWSGTYRNQNQRLLRTFFKEASIIKYAWQYPEQVTLSFNGKDTLALSYATPDSSYSYKIPGQWKGHYFEYTKKQNAIIPIFLLYFSREKIRVGNSYGEGVLVHKQGHFAGTFLTVIPFWTRYAYDVSFVPIEAEPDSLYLPFEKNVKWGYRNNKGDILIEPTYTFAYFFDEHEVAKVKSEKAWGLIDKKGNVLLPLEYDRIFDSYYPDLKIYEIRKGGKTGYVHKDGNIFIPVEYTSSLYTVSTTEPYSVYKIWIDKKAGFVDKSGLISPVIFDEISYQGFIKISKDDPNYYCNVTYKKKKYLFSTDGYLYPYKGYGVFRELLRDQRMNVWDLD